MGIAVVGARGQLGSELCRQLAGDAIPFDRADFDLVDAEAVRRVLVERRPEALINAAAFTQVDLAETEPDRCFAVNAGAVATLADVARELEIPLVQMSTDYVYCSEEPRSTPYRETDPAEPRGVYACSKLEGEHHAATCERHLIVRTCGLYGNAAPGRAPQNFVETMIRLAGEREELKVVDDQRCTPSYVPHVAWAVRFLLNRGVWGTYHVVNRGDTTWFGFASAIFRRMDIEVSLTPISTEEFDAPAPRPRYSVLDTSKYAALRGPALPHWTEALQEYLGQRRAVDHDS